ncbi:MAG TPA: C25 family cysteine peptidase [Salinivirga sp.]|uniref:C25 family cysteine peptidase n=1 Tax=Salinivirga sp. TaxID=1970192 RepID=UPI002B48058F|nr:C25 family cysteine peptidase [Salinivirga sp.]HKK60583.1 C25 family cysteine peptidase [Salinivirga sp.]
MRRILLSILAMAIMATAWAANGEKLVFKKSDNQLKVEKITQTGFNFELSVAEAMVKAKENKHGNFFMLHSKGFTKSFDIGNPNLPTKTKLIEVPFGADVKIKVLSQKTEVISLDERGFEGNLYPSQPSVAKCDEGKEQEFKFNKKTYARDAFYSNDIVVYEESGIMRGTRLGTIAINPFSYNPVTNELRVVTDLEVEITFEGADMAKTEEMKEIYGNSVFSSLLSKTMNHKVEGKPLNQNEPVKMIVIADRMFETSLQPFVEWKNMSGVITTVRYTDEPEVGNTTTSIQSFLQGLYDGATAEDPAPSFLLLVGDIGQIPAFSGESGSHVSDLYYACYDGPSDMIPDINHGRFSAQTTDQLDAIIEKTLMYEKYEMADPSYLDQTLLVAGDDESWEDVYGNGAMWYVDNLYFNAEHGINNHLFLQDPPNGNAAVHDSIIANVNAGIAWGNYTAHCNSSGWGTPSFTTSDVPSLTNDGKYGVLIGNCCLSNKFDDNECFGEALLRTANKGAIGYMGGSNSTYWDEDYWWAVGNGSPVEEPQYADFGNGNYDLMFHENGADQPYADWAITTGQVNIAGNLAVEESSSSRKLYYWEIYHLMGDPSLVPYAGVPDPITPNYQSTIFVGVGTLSITGLPEYARVALSDGGTLITTAVADASGSLTLEFDPFTTPTTADLVITGQFHQPYIGTLDVVPGTEPFVVLNEYTVNGSTAYGEAVTLDVNMKNVAEAGSGYDAANVDVTLSTEDSYVTISDNNETYGTINAGDSTTIADAFALAFADDIPDQHSILFTVTATGDDAKYTWESNFNIVVDAPVLSVGVMNIDDTGSGNGDNILDPGETANLVLTINNNGAADIDNVNSAFTINSGSEYLTFTDNTAAVGAIAAGASATATYQVTADAATPLGTPVDLTNNVTGGASDQYTASADKQVIIGFVPEYCESGATSSSDSDLTNFEFGDLANNTDGDCGQYDDFTEDPELIHEFMIGATYDVSITLGSCGGTYTKGAAVFVDWNYDGDFDDEGETALEIASEDNDWTATGTITIPADAPAGQKFVRVIVQETSSSISPCGTFTWGGTEDYKIILVAPNSPVADFEATPTETTAGMSVAFTDLTTNAPTSWDWTITPGTAGTDFEFVEGTDNTSRNPVVQFNTANSYTVELTATNLVDSDTETKTDYITINEVTEVPVADFTADVTDVYPGEVVHFTDMSTNTPTGWQWTVTPGAEGSEFEYLESTSSTSQNPAIQFNTPGYYTIELVATNEIGDSDPYSVTDMINVLPVFYMQDGSVTTCNGVFFDTGGPDGDYSSDENLTFTIYPAETGKVSRVDFVAFETEGGYDYLTIYDGEDATATQIGSYDDVNDGLSVQATNAAGALTFVFNSDGSVVDPGWEANISCVTPGNYLATFTVTDADSNPIEGATVNINSTDITTGVNGVATIDLADGTYDYTVSATGYYDATGSITVSGADVAEEVALDMEMYMVTFEVTADGAAAEGATITCPGMDPMTTDVDGHASMEMQTGTHEYTVTMDGYPDATGTFDVVDGPVTVPVNMVGINGIATANLKLYPNPNKGTFHIEVNGTYNITVMNAIGRTIHTEKVNGQATIDMNNASEGIYFIKLQDGNKVETQRFIISR